MNTIAANAGVAVGRILAISFGIIGALVALGGTIWMLDTMWFVHHAAKAVGTVVEMQREPDSDGATVYYPLYTFSDASGVTHTQRSSMGSSDFSFEAGENVTVLYDASAPKHSQIDTFQSMWLGPVFVMGFGVLFGGFAIGWLFLWSRAVKKQRWQDYI